MIPSGQEAAGHVIFASSLDPATITGIMAGIPAGIGMLHSFLEAILLLFFNFPPWKF